MDEMVTGWVLVVVEVLGVVILLKTSASIGITGFFVSSGWQCLRQCLEVLTLL